MGRHALEQALQLCLKPIILVTRILFPKIFLVKLYVLMTLLAIGLSLRPCDVFPSSSSPLPSTSPSLLLPLPLTPTSRSLSPVLNVTKSCWHCGLRLGLTWAFAACQLLHRVPKPCLASDCADTAALAPVPPPGPTPGFTQRTLLKSLLPPLVL